MACETIYDFDLPNNEIVRASYSLPNLWGDDPFLDYFPFFGLDRGEAGIQFNADSLDDGQRLLGWLPSKYG